MHKRYEKKVYLLQEAGNTFDITDIHSLDTWAVLGKLKLTNLWV